MEKALEKLGLTKNQTKVYLTLLETGLTSTKIIIKKTQLHRQIVYDSLNALLEKGLVSFVIQSNIKYFKASNPEILFNLLENQKKEINQKEKELKDLIKNLKTKQKQESKQEATIYQGNKGIKSLMDDMLNQKNEILTIGASDVKAKAFKYHLEFNLPLFHKIREKKKIKYKILLSEELKSRTKQLNKLKLTKAKILPKEFTSNSSTNIYGDKISIILWGENPFGVLIKSKEITIAQKKHFEILWKSAKFN